MTSKTSTAVAPGYPWGEGCTGWHLVQNEQLGVIQETMPPGTAEVRHYHAGAAVLLRIAGPGHLRAKWRHPAPRARRGVAVLPGQPHQLRNAAPEALKFLVVSTPHAHGDRVLAPWVAQPGLSRACL